MAIIKQNQETARDFYRRLYNSQLKDEAEWLRRGAVDKVDSIILLLERQGIQPKAFAELGCGPGAVISELRRRHLADRYVAVDASEDAISLLKQEQDGIEAHVADVTTMDWAALGSVDVVVLSHVLEHLENPGAFIDALAARCPAPWMVIEVPLEDLFFSRLKNLARDRMRNSAGHVQFFTAASFNRLLKVHGLESIDQRTYVPVQSVETVRMVSAKDGQSAFRTAFRLFTACFGPRLFGPLWRRWYYANHAVLVRKAATTRAVMPDQP